MRGTSAKQIFIIASVCLTGIIPATSASAAGYAALHSFCSEDKCADGAQPGGLTAASSGNLYGVTFQGGANTFGTIFQLKRDAKGVYSESVFYDFCAKANCTDGALPNGNLILDRAGNLYGVASEGGVNDRGAVFELVARHGAWKLKTLYNFCAQSDCTDGKFPLAGLTYAGAAKGQLYDGVSPLFGTTSSGGMGDSAEGVAYELKPGKHGWSEQVLYSFCTEQSCSDGMSPQAPLVLDDSGNLFGTTPWGGDTGQGTVFEISPSGRGWSHAMLHSFCAKENCSDGAVPLGGLAIDSGGTLYGFANGGGIVCVDTDHGPCGVIYAIAPGGPVLQYKVLYTFGEGGRADDGANPSGSPILDAAGNLFGTTIFGGTGFFGGVAFKLSGAKLKVLHTFCAAQGDGCQPNGLIRDSKGRLFGTTDAGGTGLDSKGMAFEIRP